jgi:hypothetical protein
LRPCEKGASTGDLWKILVNPLFTPIPPKLLIAIHLIVEDDPAGLELMTQVLQSPEAFKKGEAEASPDRASLKFN